MKRQGGRRREGADSSGDRGRTFVGRWITTGEAGVGLGRAEAGPRTREADQERRHGQARAIHAMPTLITALIAIRALIAAKHPSIGVWAIHLMVAARHVAHRGEVRRGGRMPAEAHAPWSGSHKATSRGSQDQRGRLNETGP